MTDLTHIDYTSINDEIVAQAQGETTCLDSDHVDMIATQGACDTCGAWASSL